MELPVFCFFFMGGGLLFQFSYTANALTRSAHREPPFHCHLYIFISLIPRFPFLLLLPFLISVPCVLSYFLILNTRSFVNFVFSGVKSPVFMVFSSGGVRAPPDSDEPRGQHHTNNTELVAMLYSLYSRRTETSAG